MSEGLMQHISQVYSGTSVIGSLHIIMAATSAAISIYFGPPKFSLKAEEGLVILLLFAPLLS